MEAKISTKELEMKTDSRKQHFIDVAPKMVYNLDTSTNFI